LLLAGFGLALEVVADSQKFRFKRSNPKQFMKSGVWSLLQHPNYSGELLFWWGLFIACLPFTVWYYTILGPIWISLIIIRFSGISILQKKWMENYGDDPEFQAYQKRTSKLIPFIY
jgi:steroid 5-alpha reductase family enzyme